MKHISQIVVFLFISLSLFQCSSDDPAPVECQLVKVSRDDNYVFTYTYDSQSRLTKVLFGSSTEPSSVRTFAFSGNEIAISYGNVTTPGGIDNPPLALTVQLNADGFPLSATSPDNTNWYKFEYKNGVLEHYVSKNSISLDSLLVTFDAASKNITTVVKYSWNEGSKVFENPVTSTYTYDDKINPFYKVFLSHEISVLEYFSENNALNRGSAEFSWEYNSNNYPIQRDIVGSSSDPLIYEYACK
ncbi:MAG: hypothetical protein ABJH04_11730 [Cyclobacteriaceae bacterium]